jgi:hypothetical protein
MMDILRYPGSSSKQKGENSLTLMGYEARIVYGQKVSVLKANDVTLGRNGHHYPYL